MAQEFVIGRQTGQSVEVTTPTYEVFTVTAEKCQNGYVRLRIECPEPFDVRYGTGHAGRPVRRPSEERRGRR